MKHTILFLLFLISLFSCAATGKSVPQDFHHEEDLDSFILERMELSHKPGLQASVFSAEEILWQESYGFSHCAEQRRVSEETPFYVGSISKLVVGAAIMQLVEQGVLNLQGDVNNYLDFPVRNPAYPQEPITVEMLLTHSAGIAMNFPRIWFTKSKGDYTGDIGDFCREYLVSRGRYYSDKNFADFAPGQGFVYSNVSFTLLAHILEEETGLTLEEYCRRHIFDPLRMDNSSWTLSYYQDNEPAWPHVQRWGRFTSGGYFSFPIYPAAFMLSTSEDLTQFMQCMFQGGSYHGQVLLTRESVDSMMQIQQGIQPIYWDEMGYVWQFKELEEGYSLIGHSGGFPGGIAALSFYDPQRDRGVVMLMNGNWQTRGTYDRFQDESIREIFLRLMEKF